MPFLNAVLRTLFTVLALALAVVLVVALWRAYVLAPWTRDGRVSAHVVQVAPEVSGTVIEVAVTDNEPVHKGDVLYRIDPRRFELAVSQAQAQLDASSETLRQRAEEARRRSGLDDLMPKEDIQRARRAVSIAQAEHDQALAALEVAQLNLQRSTLYSPVEGYVTHLRLQQGDYTQAGKPGVSVLDAESFWITGYFEETKLRQIRPGDSARVKLMGFDPLLKGHVASIGRGIADLNDSPDEKGLPSVRPTFSWIRLAQRIPVRVTLDEVPDGIILAAGMTCSVEVDKGSSDNLAQGHLASWLHALM